MSFPLASPAAPAATPPPDGGQLAATVEHATLAGALATVAVAVNTHALPIARAVLLRGDADGTLTVTANDYDTAVSVTVPDAAHTPGTVLVDHRELSRLLKGMVSGRSKRAATHLPVTLDGTDPASPTLSVGEYTVRLNGLPAEDHPGPRQPFPTVADVERTALTTAVGRVMPAVAPATTPIPTPVLTGIHLTPTPGTLTLAATDRYRLAVAPVPAIGDADQDQHADGVTLPGAVLAALARHWATDRVRLGLEDPGDPTPGVSLVCGPVSAVIRTIGDQFPSYTRLLARTGAGAIVVDRGRLLEQVRRVAAILAAGTTRDGLAALTVNAETVSVAPHFHDGARNTQVRAPDLPATVTAIDEPTRWLFTPGRLADALTSFTGDTVTLHPGDTTTRPVLFTDTADGIDDPAAYRHLLMPVST